MALPSAETSQNLTKPNNTCEVDLISRADAIKAIQNAYCKPCKERGDDYNEVRCRACEYDNAIIQIDAVPSAEAYFTDGNKIDEWIPCSERLPSVSGTYLTTTAKGSVCTDHFYNNMTDIGGRHWSYHRSREPVAWMPLPMPYREDGEA